MDIVDAIKKQKLHDILDLSVLPPGQRRAVVAFIGGNKARTYTEASDVAGMSLGTLFTHLHRVRLRHPALYEAIRVIRLSQLAKRHEEALQAAWEHSRAHFKRKANYRYYQRFGHWPCEG